MITPFLRQVQFTFCEHEYMGREFLAITRLVTEYDKDKLSMVTLKPKTQYIDTVDKAKMRSELLGVLQRLGIAPMNLDIGLNEVVGYDTVIIPEALIVINVHTTIDLLSGESSNGSYTAFNSKVDMLASTAIVTESGECITCLENSYSEHRTNPTVLLSNAFDPDTFLSAAENAELKDKLKRIAQTNQSDRDYFNNWTAGCPTSDLGVHHLLKLMALAGNAFVDIPKQWDNSTATLDEPKPRVTKTEVVKLPPNIKVTHELLETQPNEFGVIVKGKLYLVGLDVILPFKDKTRTRLSIDEPVLLSNQPITISYEVVLGNDNYNGKITVMHEPENNMIRIIGTSFFKVVEDKIENLPVLIHSLTVG